MNSQLFSATREHNRNCLSEQGANQKILWITKQEIPLTPSHIPATPSFCSTQSPPPDTPASYAPSTQSGRIRWAGGRVAENYGSPFQTQSSPTASVGHRSSASPRNRETSPGFASPQNPNPRTPCRTGTPRPSHWLAQRPFPHPSSAARKSAGRSKSFPCPAAHRSTWWLSSPPKSPRGSPLPTPERPPIRPAGCAVPHTPASLAAPVASL